MLIGVDVGGTFTDLVLSGDDGALQFVKVPSTPADPSEGVLDAVTLMAQERGQTLDALLEGVETFIHGTTVATNILVERKGAKVGLITTKGFRDLLELRDGARKDRYALRSPRPDPLIPRPLRLEIDERIDARGTVTTEMDMGSVARAIEALRAAGVDSLVVCLINAHRNPEHERKVAEAIAATGWTPFVSLSHAVLGREGEYDRLSTAAVNGYVGPGLQTYLGRLGDRMAGAGLKAPIYVMQSTGGVLGIEDAAQRAVGAVTSGPAGGAMAGALFARLLNEPEIVGYDTGGTTTDISLIDGGRPVERGSIELGELRITAPAIEIRPLGVGGGSLARLDGAGLLAVGPESAGAVPGPACFGRGGTRATLTDANLVLGMISPEGFLGGRMSLSVEAARAAIEADVATPLGLGIEDAAWAVHVLASSKIVEDVRLSTVRRGKDPRDIALMPFGGAGSLHADHVARELQIPRVIIPRMASVLSALGFLAADVRQDLSRTMGVPLADLSETALDEIFAALEAEGRALLTGADAQALSFERSIDCRYPRQVHAIPVSIGSDTDPAAIEQHFRRSYEALYHHVHEAEPGVIDSCRLSTYGALPKISLPRTEPGDPDPSPAMTARRRVYLGQWTEVPCYDFDRLAAGMTINGPAIVESASTTVQVAEGSVAKFHPLGCLIIERRS